MGVDVADTHIHLHGEGDDHHAPQVRLHWGALSIDETHTATAGQVATWAADYASADWSALQTHFYAWMSSVGVSGPAWTARFSFAEALRRAFGPG
jgi:hypothetical protein